MPKLGEQPTSINRERFDKNEENSENIKKQLHEAMASGDADKIIELGGQMKNLKAQKEEFKGQDEGEAYEENAKIKDHEDANEMNKQFDETKAAEEIAKEKARIAEETRIQAENEATQLAAVRAKINGGGSEIPTKNVETVAEKTEPVAVENAEQIKSPEEKQYEFFKGTLTFDENGKMDSVFHILRDNPVVMLEAYKKNPKNLHWVSKRLSEDPEFIKQLEALGAETKDGVLKKNAYSNQFDEIDKNEKPTQENIDKAKSETVAFNLARGSRSLEEMGVSKDFARVSIKDNLIKDLNKFFGNGGTFNGEKQIKTACEAAGINVEELKNDPDVRQAIVETAIPRFCSHIAGDKSSSEWVGSLINNLSRTFNVTKEDWEKAMQNPVSGNSVREYYNNRNSY